MKVRERLRGLRDQARGKLHEARMERADRERERLRLENDALRERLESVGEERSRWLDTIEGLSKSHARVGKPHRLRRTLVVVGAAGSAYVMGAKAGRERYEQIKRWWGDLRSRAASKRDAIEMRGSDRASVATRSSTSNTAAAAR